MWFDESLEEYRHQLKFDLEHLSARSVHNAESYCRILAKSAREASIDKILKPSNDSVRVLNIFADALIATADHLRRSFKVMCECFDFDAKSLVRLLLVDIDLCRCVRGYVSKHNEEQLVKWADAAFDMLMNNYEEIKAFIEDCEKAKMLVLRKHKIGAN